MATKEQLIKLNIDSLEAQKERLETSLNNLPEHFDRAKKRLKAELKLYTKKHLKEQQNYIKEQISGVDIIIETLRKEIENEK